MHPSLSTWVFRGCNAQFQTQLQTPVRRYNLKGLNILVQLSAGIALDYFFVLKLLLVCFNFFYHEPLSLVRSDYRKSKVQMALHIKRLKQKKATLMRKILIYPEMLSISTATLWMKNLSGLFSKVELSPLNLFLPLVSQTTGGEMKKTPILVW